MNQNELDKSSKPNKRKSNSRLVNVRRSRHPEQQQVEDALLLMENIIRCSSSAIAACDLKGNMTYGNPTFHRMWGFDDPKEYLRKPFWQFWLVEDRLDEIMQALRGDGSWFDKIKAQRKDGTIFDVQVSASMVYDRDGDPVALTSTSIDITEQKQMENFLIESEQRLRLAINTAGLAIWDWNISQNTVVWEDPWQNFIDDPLQKENAYEWWTERIHPDDRNDAISIFKKALTDRDESLVMEYRFQCADGTWRNVYDRSQILHNESGQAYRIIGALMDVTNLRKAEEELRQGEVRFRMLANSMPQLAWTANADGRVDYFNERYKEYQGIERMSNGSFQWSPTLHDEDKAPTVTKWNQAVQMGKPYQIEHRTLHKDGRYRWHLSRAIPAHDDQGKLIKWFGTSTDIEDLRQVELRLRQLNENLETIVAERTALAESRARQLQNLAIQLIEAEENERQRIAQLLHDDMQQLLASAKLQLENACVNLPGIPLLEKVQDILKESIVKSRRLSHELSPAVLYHSGLVAGLEWLFIQMSKQFGLTVHFENQATERFDNTPLNIFLFRSVQELLFNIVKYAEVKTAWVKISKSEKNLIISVADKGKGFNPDVIHGSGKKNGLGLLTITERANHIGGNLTIESAPGCGSRFMLTVPITAEQTDDPQKILPPSKQLPSFKTDLKISFRKSDIRVLFVDDHKVMRQGLIQLINSQPDIYVVGEATNGREAIEQIRLNQPDLVVMDISMPEMDGIEATRQIKTEFPEVRVIGLSMYDDEHIKQTMCQAGADVVISKAVSSAELLKAIYKGSKKKSGL
jgi:PAS domain S-box-containing protein